MYSWVLPLTCGALTLYDAGPGPDILDDAGPRASFIASCALLGYSIDQLRLEKRDYIYDCPELTLSHKGNFEIANALAGEDTETALYLKRLDCKLVGTNPAFLYVQSGDHPKYRPITTPKPKKKKAKKATNTGLGLSSSLSGPAIGFDKTSMDLSLYYRRDLKPSYLQFQLGFDHDRWSDSLVDFSDASFPTFQFTYGRYIPLKKQPKNLLYSWGIDLYISPSFGNVAFGGNFGINYRTAEEYKAGLDLGLQLGLGYSSYNGVNIPVSLMVGSYF